MVLLAIFPHHHREVRKWNFSTNWKAKLTSLIVERMRRTIADALSRYKPMREECVVAMARHRNYERTLITK